MEVIRLPYSVYSHPRCRELTNLIREMGYCSAKMYPPTRAD